MSLAKAKLPDGCNLWHINSTRVACEGLLRRLETSLFVQSIGDKVYFFLHRLQFYKYSTLRPQIDVRDRLPVCPSAPPNGIDDHRPCVTRDRVQAASNIYRSMMELLVSTL
jgi:hypothetical protein